MNVYRHLLPIALNYWVRIQLGGLMNKNEGDVLEIQIDELFQDIDETPASDEESKALQESKKLELTQSMTKRINEVKAKTERETRDSLAKELGYENYADMKRAEENNIIKKQGYDPDDLEKVLEPLMKKRLADDPRLKRLEALEQRERDEYIQAQIIAINEATGQQLKITDLPQATLDLWAKGIDLEQAYYATHGKQIINKVKTQIENGTLNHLATGSSSQQPKMRRLTEEEKSIYRAIAPHLTEEELNKKTTQVK